MENLLRLTIVQPDTYWEKSDANRAELEEIIMALKEETDLIVLPETFSTGFSSNAIELAEPMNFTTHKWMKQIAAQTQAAICGSFLVKVGSSIFNRFLFVKPDGETEFYDKKHLFSIGSEKEQFSAGNSQIIVSWKGWNIKPLICYDLRFPVWARNINLEYDLLIYSANWPAARQDVWNTLLKARAIENQSFVVGVNRVGIDGNNIQYQGGSQIIHPKGYQLDTLPSNQSYLQVHLSKSELDTFRNKFPVHLDADKFSLL